MADEAKNAGSEQRIGLAAGSQGNMEVVVHIDGKQEGSSSPQNTALLVATSSFYRRRHKKSLPEKQIPLGSRKGSNNSFGVLIDTNGQEKEGDELPLPKQTIALAGIQGDVVVELPGPVDVPEEPIIARNQEAEASPAPREEEEEFEAAAADGATAGLPEQALETIVGNYIERVGQVIALIGLGTITSTIGGLFTREPPSLFLYFLIHQDHDQDQDLQDGFPTFESSRKALILYYKCLPAFFVVGLLELCYGIWVSRNQQVRAGKRAKTVLILSAILLIVTVCFTGVGISE